MQNGLHTIGVGFQRLGIVAGVIVLGVILSYIVLVFVLVVIQAAATFGQ